MIFISAGHYPASPGATCDRFIEHDEAALWANIMVHKLGIDDGNLVPTGTLKSKVDYINNRIMPKDIAIEIHFNSAMSKGKHVGRGCETLYYPGSESGKHIATLCQDALAITFPPSRGG